MNKRRIKILALALVLILLAGAGIASGLGLFKPKETDKKQEAREELLDMGIINVLLLGIDARPGETKARSDTMILASIDTTNKKVGLISIPRDTRIKDGDHYEKINSYTAFGGPELAKEKVEELLGVPVHYYALTNFSGFKDIIDILGGVTIDVDKRMYKPSEKIDLQPGVQRLDGSQALAYCRYRTDALGDITRIQRQQNFIKAVAAEMMKPATLAKLPKLVPSIAKCVTTDIPMSKLLKVAQAAEQFREGQSQMAAQALPGWFYNDPDTGASYWVVDEQKLAGILDKVLSGETMDFIEGTLNGGQMAEKPKNNSKPKTETPVVEEPQQPEEPEEPVEQPEQPGQNDPGIPQPPDNGGNNGGSPEPDPNDTAPDNNLNPSFMQTEPYKTNPS